MNINSISNQNINTKTNIVSKEINSEKSFEKTLNDIKKTENTSKNSDTEKLRNVSQQLEQMLIKQVFNGMLKSVPDSGFVEKSHARSMFEDMYNDEMAKEMTKSGDFGLADMIFDQMQRFILATDEEKEAKSTENEKKLKNSNNINPNLINDKYL